MSSVRNEHTNSDAFREGWSLRPSVAGLADFVGLAPARLGMSTDDVDGKLVVGSRMTCSREDTCVNKPLDRHLDHHSCKPPTSGATGALVDFSLG